MSPLLTLVLLVAVGAAHADSWPGPVVRGSASYDGRFVVRVHPGESLGDVVGFAGAKKGRFARAIVYLSEGEERYVKLREIELLNPVAPVDFVVSSAGELVTLDNWHNMGMGKVLVVYGPDGTVRRSYSLSDIYSRHEVAKFDVSTSSIWWRCPSPPVLERGANQLELADKLGNTVEVNLKTGALSKTPTKRAC